MTYSERNLLLTIARNSKPQKTFDMLKRGMHVDNEYTEIVQHQIDRGIRDMHLPEPWNGHLSTARIMLISSNPSISEYEDFPTKNWSDDRIVDFFDNRFFNNMYTNASYWGKMSKYVSWILPEASNIPPSQVLDKYVVGTEVVHCKSSGEEGVKNCLFEESKYMDSIINEFSGDVVIIVGAYARRMFQNEEFSINRRCKIAFIDGPTYPLSDEERKRKLLQQLM